MGGWFVGTFWLKGLDQLYLKQRGRKEEEKGEKEEEKEVEEEEEEGKEGVEEIE